MNKKGPIQKIKCWITSENEISLQNKMLLALLFLLGAIIFGCMYYGISRKTYWLNPLFFLKKDELLFRFPYLIHGVAGLLLAVPLYIRNILPFKSFSPYYLLTSSMNILFFAVMAQLIIGPSNTIRNDWISTMLIIAIVLTWLGIRSVAGLSWILVFGLATFNLVRSSYEMKHWGLPFLICALLSLLLQTQLSPKEFFKTIEIEFKGFSESKFSYSVKDSIQQAIETSKQSIKEGIKSQL